MAHVPVMLDEVLNVLLPDDRMPERVIDGTLGAGGHTKALLDAGVETVLSFDLDPSAMRIADELLAPYGDRSIRVLRSYADMRDEVQKLDWDGVDGILLDLGVSSMQLDTPERGFAFMHDGPLDMRFNPDSTTPPASELVNYWDERDLADIFFRYGEERESRRLANVIVKHRPYETTRQLADVIKQFTKHNKKKTIHPATQIFQALRIAVNDELRIIEKTLPDAIDLLNRGGRLAVISFHSLEDRIVKNSFRDAAEEIKSPPGMVLEEKQAIVKLVTRKPITATDEEIEQNPRSRSAKLRVVEKL